MLESVQSANERRTPHEPHDDELVRRLYHELRETLASDPSCLDPSVLLYKSDFRTSSKNYLENITDHCVIGLDASLSEPLLRVPLGHFFCIHGKGTLEGLDPGFKRAMGLDDEQEQLVMGFYFMPSDKFSPALFNRVRTLYHTITYEGGNISTLVLDSDVTAAMIESFENERLRNLKKAESEFFCRTRGSNGRKRNTTQDYYSRLEREADRAALEAEGLQKMPESRAEALDEREQRDQQQYNSATSPPGQEYPRLDLNGS